MATGKRQIDRFQRPHAGLKTSQQETPSNISLSFINNEHFHVLQIGPSISCPAISRPAILMVRHFHVKHFQSTRHVMLIRM